MSRCACSFALRMIALVSSTSLALGVYSDYQESVDGEISDVYTAPTEMVFGLGANVIAGTIGASGSGATSGGTAFIPLDADYFGFELGEGHSVDSIYVTRVGASNDSRSFLGYQNDNKFVALTSTALDAFVFVEHDTDYVDDLPTLGQGQHAFWLQETGGVFDYSITFNVVPEPASMLLIGGLSLAAMNRRRSR